MPVLVIARHAHAEDGAGSDFDRRLTAAGEAEAARAADFLAPLPLTHLVASPAARTRATGEALVRALRERGGAEAVLESDPALYNGPVQAWLDAIAAIPGDAAGAYIVGHQPSAAATVEALTGTAPESFRPSSVAVFELDSWDVEPGQYPAPQLRDFV